MSRTLVTIVTSALVCAAVGCARPPHALTIATTTSVANSGLLDVLASAYEREAGLTVRSHLVGSGRALAMLASGEVDVALTHAPTAEAAALRDRPTWRYSKFMYNDFVIVGPGTDPAGVRHSTTAVQAMQTIARAGVRFISRGDSSGTHEREEELWMKAGARPDNSKLIVAGSGMGATLRIASEMEAYTLTDRATFMQQEVRLVILVERDHVLINTYAVVFDGARPPDKRAERFAAWLIEGAGRQSIDQFRVGPKHVAAFIPWPLNRPRTRPSDLP